MFHATSPAPGSTIRTRSVSPFRPTSRSQIEDRARPALATAACPCLPTGSPPAHPPPHVKSPPLLCVQRLGEQEQATYGSKTGQK